MSNIMNGSTELLSALETTSNIRGLDLASKQILKHKEVLAIILKEVIQEYQGYSIEEIMDFIEADSIVSRDVSPGRTNTIIKGENTEFSELDEKTSLFDVMFLSKNPKLSSKHMRVNLHVDIEPQKTYRPGYPIEKRGTYYLARSLSSQLNLLTENTDYGNLEKCYSIWICRDKIPENERFTISFYQMSNTRNVGDCCPNAEDYDLLTLVIIRLGSDQYDKNANDLFHFLTLLFYPQKPDFMEQMGNYINFEQNLKLCEEVRYMDGLGESILEEGRRLERAQVINNLLQKGMSEQQISELTGYSTAIIRETKNKD